jgi:TolB-like protein/Tfp pilus assembly protein PilF
MRSRAHRIGVSEAAKQRHAAYRSRKHPGDTPITVSTISGMQPLWPCLSSSIAVVVMPLRNLTGDPDWQSLAEAFTEHLVSHLHRHGRAFSLHQAIDQPGASRSGAGPAGPRTGYIVDGSVQRGYSGTFRVNMRIKDAATTEYLWAHRYQYPVEQIKDGEKSILHQISRELHLLLLENEIRRAALSVGAEHEPIECLSNAALALEGELRAGLTAEAQRWFLAALAADPRNVEALTGLARTCQYLVSNPWWADPRFGFAASDLGREAIAVALSFAPGHADAHCVQGMLYSAAGQLEDAAGAFAQALAMDHDLAIAHGFAGYNAALLGRAHETLPAIDRAMRLDPGTRRHSIWFFFGGFAELLVGRIDCSIALFQKSLERNPSYGSALLFLVAALSLSGRDSEAARTAMAFRRHYPDCPSVAFEQLWLSRSASAGYRAQISPLLERIRNFAVAT